MTIDKAIHHLYTYSSTHGSGITTDVQHEEAKRIAIDTMRKYQKIQEIHKKWFCDYTSAEAYTKISEVLEDGNDDN